MLAVQGLERKLVALVATVLIGLVEGTELQGLRAALQGDPPDTVGTVEWGCISVAVVAGGTYGVVRLVKGS